jgi:hypothetical protein
MTRFSWDGERLPTLEAERPPVVVAWSSRFVHRHETELDGVMLLQDSVDIQARFCQHILSILSIFESMRIADPSPAGSSMNTNEPHKSPVQTLVTRY